MNTEMNTTMIDAQDVRTFYDLVDKNPNLNWDWPLLGANPNFQIEEIIYLRDKYNKPRKLHLCQNPHFKIEHVFKYKNEQIDWTDLSAHPNITMDIVQEHSYMRWDSNGLVFNPNLTLEFCQNEKNKPASLWNYLRVEYTDSDQYDCFNNILRNSNITIPGLIQYIKDNKNIDTSYFFNNPNLIISEIQDPLILHEFERILSGTNWCQQYTYQNPNIDINFVNKYKHLPLKWDHLVVKQKITVEDILENSQFPWIDKWWLNPNVRPHHLIKHNITDSNKWDTASKYSTFDCISGNLNYPWNWYNLSSNINLNLEFIENNINHPWNWSVLSENPILTIDFVVKNPEIKWDYKKMSKNKMTFNKTIQLKNHINNLNFIIQNLKQVIQLYV